jgi:hypothetical protein
MFDERGQDRLPSNLQRSKATGAESGHVAFSISLFLLDFSLLDQGRMVVYDPARTVAHLNR